MHRILTLLSLLCVWNITQSCIWNTIYHIHLGSNTIPLYIYKISRLYTVENAWPADSLSTTVATNTVMWCNLSFSPATTLNHYAFLPLQFDPLLVCQSSRPSLTALPETQSTSPSIRINNTLHRLPIAGAAICFEDLPDDACPNCLACKRESTCMLYSLESAGSVVVSLCGLWV